jgi:hypothetical protein
MKTIYVEKWECVRSSYGKLYKLDLGKIAEEEMYPENPKDALDSIEWQGFNRGYPSNDMSPDDAQNKDDIIKNLKKKLEEFTKEP